MNAYELLMYYRSIFGWTCVIGYPTSFILAFVLLAISKKREKKNGYSRLGDITKDIISPLLAKILHMSLSLWFILLIITYLMSLH